MVFISNNRNLQMKDKDQKGKLSIVKNDGEVTELHPSADTVLKGFIGQGISQVLVISLDNEGTFRTGSNTSSKGEMLFLVEQFKHCLLEGEFDA